MFQNRIDINKARISFSDVQLLSSWFSQPVALISQICSTKKKVCKKKKGSSLLSELKRRGYLEHCAHSSIEELKQRAVVQLEWRHQKYKEIELQQREN